MQPCSKPSLVWLLCWLSLLPAAQAEGSLPLPVVQEGGASPPAVATPAAPAATPAATSITTPAASPAMSADNPLASSLSARIPRCPPVAQLEIYRQQEWQLENGYGRLLRELLECMGEDDPLLRDTYGFEGMQTILRRGDASPRELRLLRKVLLWRLDYRAGAPRSVVRTASFAALALAEIARVERLQSFMKEEERDELIDATDQYLRNIDDYHAWDLDAGWQHAVAHGADLVLQQALHPKLTPAQHAKLWAALDAQLLPPYHAWQHGEGFRLARALYALAQRADYDKARWQAWVEKLAAQTNWHEPVQQSMLVQRHNLEAVWYPLYFLLQEGKPGAARSHLLPLLASRLAGLQ